MKTKERSRESESRQVKLSPAEWIVMRAVWSASPNPNGEIICTVPDLAEQLKAKTAWSVSTVNTLVSRLHLKGALSLRKLRNLRILQARISLQEAERAELNVLLKTVFEGDYEALIASVHAMKK